MRRLLAFVLALGLVGTAAELLLLQHYEDGWQALPLVLIGMALLVMVWHAVSHGAASVLVLRVLMTVFLAGGAIGAWFHYRANAEFELEMDPSLAGLALLKESMSGATPALAPGTMIELGLIGLVYTYRHPRLARVSSPDVRRQEWDA